MSSGLALAHRGGCQFLPCFLTGRVLQAIAEFVAPVKDTPDVCRPAETTTRSGYPGVRTNSTSLDRIGVRRLQQPVAGDRMRRLALRNLQQGRTALSHIRARIVIAIVLQILTL
jgi:hypothetical protein